MKRLSVHSRHSMTLLEWIMVRLRDEASMSPRNVVMENNDIPGRMEMGKCL